ncbi:MAG: acyltransferase [Pseudomonadota bacterium]
MKTFGDLARGHDNNFNLLRIVAALCVVAAHCMLTIGSSAETTVDNMTGWSRTAADLALDLFFAFSGFLLTASLVKNQNLVRYWVARLLRMIPGLLLVSALLMFVVGPAMTTLSLGDYFADLRVWEVPFRMAVVFDSSATLPGVFGTGTVPAAINMPIWTLRYEIVLYIALCCVFLLGLLNGKNRFGAFLLISIAAYFFGTLASDIRANGDFFDHIFHFGISFVIGAAFWTYRAHVPHHWSMLIALWSVVWLVRPFAIFEFCSIVAASYSFFFIAFLPWSVLRRYNRFGDYSYGTYIMHWPVAQCYFASNPEMNSVLLTGLTMATTLPLAILSWRYLEGPALSRVERASVLAERSLEGLGRRIGLRQSHLTPASEPR